MGIGWACKAERQAQVPGAHGGLSLLPEGAVQHELDFQLVPEKQFLMQILRKGLHW